MLIKRYLPEEEIDESLKVDHFKKFFKKVKKRQLKSNEDIDNNSSVKKQKQNEPHVNPVNEEVKLDNFAIIGGHKFEKNDRKIKAELPKWLAQPKLIPVNLEETSNNFPDLNSRILINLKNNNVDKLFPVQQAVIPYILQQTNLASIPSSHYIPRDICVSSPTGSGKTLTYVLPIVQCLINRLVPFIRCLVIVPVQELAIQVANVFHNYIKGTSLKVETITGGKTPLNIEQDRILKKLPNGKFESLIDIAVMTPGRLVEHIQKTEGFNLRGLKYLVIDEADRILDGIQNDWIYYLEKHLDQEIGSLLTLNYLNRKNYIIQKLLFSATLTQDPEKLKKLNLLQPILFTSIDTNNIDIENNFKIDKDGNHVSKYAMPKELDEFYIVVESYMKPIVIAELLTIYKWRRILCFCKSAAEANRLSKLISIMCPSLKVKDISSLLHGTTRNLILNQFSNGVIDMLISSDVMARGIDIPQVNYVISYDPPKHFRGYVHRAGRTGRAGVSGSVITITTPNQLTPFIQKLESNKNKISEMKMDKNLFEKRANNYKKALKILKQQSKIAEKNAFQVRKLKDNNKKKNNKTKKRKIKKPN